MKNSLWKFVPLEQAVNIFDTVRQPINRKERMKRIENKEILYPYYGATGQVDYIDDYLLDGEYVLLGEDGAPFLNPLENKAYIVNGKFWVNNHAHILQSKTNNKFLCYYLNTVNYKALVTGTTRYKLTQAAMKRIIVPVPPLPEQERIVAHIEELFSELDAGMETLKKTKAQLDVYRQAVLKEAFEGHLTKSKQVSASVLSEFIEKPHYGTSKKCTYENNGYKAVYRIPNINHAIGRISKDDIKYAQFTQTELQNIELHNGDLLIIRSNGSINLVGRAAIIYESDTDATFAGYLMRLRINDPSILNPFFLLHYLQSHSARIYIESKAKSTSGVHNINSQEISQLPIPLYKIEDQKKIVAEIESRLSVCNNIEQTIDATLEQAKALRHSILKEAFEGSLAQ